MTAITIDADALARDMQDLSRIGATAEGGVHREAATAADGAARDWLRGRLLAEGFEVRVDGVGNMYGLPADADLAMPLVLAGSHLDSQPYGGRFDGPAGVLAALHAILAVRRAAATGQARPGRRLGLINWTNEEGSRFAPSLMGSSVFAGLLPADAALAARDRGGTSLAAALEAIGYLGRDPAPDNVAAYLELHIEQGTALERAGIPVGTVEGNWGTAKYIVEVKGRAAHTGPTPMADRRDALLPAARLVLEARAISDATGGVLLSSVGRIDVLPNSTNIVADTVRVFAELRDVDGDRLAAACARFEVFARGLAGPGISVALEKPTDRPARSFDAGLKAVIEAAAHRRGIRPLRLHTIAGHDAVAVGARLPAAMLFIPCRDGISHNPAEFVSDRDLLRGTGVLAEALADLSVHG